MKLPAGKNNGSKRDPKGNACLRIKYFKKISPLEIAFDNNRNVHKYQTARFKTLDYFSFLKILFI
jgi:hypothetical protein